MTHFLASKHYLGHFLGPANNATGLRGEVLDMQAAVPDVTHTALDSTSAQAMLQSYAMELAIVAKQERRAQRELVTESARAHNYFYSDDE